MWILFLFNTEHKDDYSLHFHTLLLYINLILSCIYTCVFFVVSPAIQFFLLQFYFQFSSAPCALNARPSRLICLIILTTPDEGYVL